MGRKNKEKVIIPGVQIESLAAEGVSLARHEGRVLFIPFGAPGDIVTVQLGRRKKQWAEAVIVEMEEPAKDRAEPVCSHFGVCGGCKWQHIPYQMQLAAKQQQVIDQFERLGKFEFPEVQPILGADPILEYRNKVEFSFSSNRWRTREEMDALPESVQDACGFHAPGRFDKVLEISHCYLTDEWTNEARNFVRDRAREMGLAFYNPRTQRGAIRNLLFRDTNLGQRLVLLVFGPDCTEEQMQELSDKFVEKFPDAYAVLNVKNDKPNDTLSGLEFKSVNGKSTITAEMDGLYFKISVPSFFQTNSQQALELYRRTLEMADVKSTDIVYDLYTGTGTIACFLARHAGRVIGIEYVQEAVQDAEENAGRNGLNNMQFFAGDMKDVLTMDFAETYGKPGVVVCDPPRAGMHADVISRLMEMRPERIVYVSCNPASQARDIALMIDFYKVVAVQPVDMFPHTHHVENIVKLELL
jgi:23S rRNA (uracil1939-C5)-methyltransferase